MTKPAFFPYFGGKYRIAKHIIALMPDHHCYVEVFGGAANVLIQKPKSKVEVYNDINSDIVNLFRMVRNHYSVFLHKARHTPYSREVFDEYRECLKTETDPIERAYMWFCVQDFSFAAHHRTFGTSIEKNQARAFKNRVDSLNIIVDRLREVQIENDTYDAVLDRYDKANVLFYLDPPYLPSTRRSGDYTHDMTEADHVRLINRLQTIKGNVILSGYPNALYEKLGWRSITKEVNASSASRTKTSGLQGNGNCTHQRRTEVLWMNF